MKKKPLITRREALASGIAALSGLLLPGCKNELPPTYGHLLRMGDALTYAAHRAMLPGQSLAREFSFSDISSFPATGATNPGDSGKSYYNELYERLQKNSFAEWKLSIEGLVSKPGFYTLDALQRFPAQTQITRHTCEEGWSAIAQWTGVRLSRVLEAAGILPSARFLNIYTFDGYYDCLDMLDAFHPQTMLTYGMNGSHLPIQHGAPVRLRVEGQLGYKSLKYLQRLVVADTFDDMGKNGNIQNGWAWYAGI